MCITELKTCFFVSCIFLYFEVNIGLLQGYSMSLCVCEGYALYMGEMCQSIQHLIILHRKTDSQSKTRQNFPSTALYNVSRDLQTLPRRDLHFCPCAYINGNQVTPVSIHNL